MAATIMYAMLPIKLDYIRTNLLNTLTLHLFKNNHPPDPDDTVAAYTEADFDGYAAQAVLDFAPSFLTSGHQAESDTGVHTFEMTGAVTPNTIYGYYLTKPGGALFAAELNPAGGFLMDAAGKTFSVKLSDVLD